MKSKIRQRTSTIYVAKYLYSSRVSTSTEENKISPNDDEQAPVADDKPFKLYGLEPGLSWITRPTAEQSCLNHVSLHCNLASLVDLLVTLFGSIQEKLPTKTSGDRFEIRRNTEFYKGVQKAGAIIAWQINMHKVSFLFEPITNWAIPLLTLLIIRVVKDEDDEVVGKMKED